MKGSGGGVFVGDESMEPMDIKPAARIIVIGGCHPDRPVEFERAGRMFEIPVGA